MEENLYDVTDIYLVIGLAVALNPDREDAAVRIAATNLADKVSVTDYRQILFPMLKSSKPASVYRKTIDFI